MTTLNRPLTAAPSALAAPDSVPSVAARQLAGTIVSQFGNSGDNALSRDELRLGGVWPNEATFRQLDTNANNRIDLMELAKGLDRLGPTQLQSVNQRLQQLQSSKVYNRKTPLAVASSVIGLLGAAGCGGAALFGLGTLPVIGLAISLGLLGFGIFEGVKGAKLSSRNDQIDSQITAIERDSIAAVQR